MLIKRQLHSINVFVLVLQQVVSLGVSVLRLASEGQGTVDACRIRYCLSAYTTHDLRECWVIVLNQKSHWKMNCKLINKKSNIRDVLSCALQETMVQCYLIIPFIPSLTSNSSHPYSLGNSELKSYIRSRYRLKLQICRRVKNVNTAHHADPYTIL